MANEKIDLRQGSIAHLSCYGQAGSNPKVRFADNHPESLHPRGNVLRGL
jgi:hypothetical protein